ncbi:MAG: hypothetical protein OHK93_000465 [Ramalina farinacea]|uniref:Uncharacterized protein n=1 Tax=Ramalina farinacea TaxID=258253 RepID=A0AA43TR67_9LECA|nr:hypothetical protein [Ramalina farinacea]
MAVPDDGPRLEAKRYCPPPQSPPTTAPQSFITHPNGPSHPSDKRLTGKRPDGQSITKQTEISFSSEVRSPQKYYLSSKGPAPSSTTTTTNNDNDNDNSPSSRPQARDNDFATKVDHNGRMRVTRNYEEQYRQWTRSRSAHLTQEEEAMMGSAQPNEERIAALHKPRRSFSRRSFPRLSKLSRSKSEPRRRLPLGEASSSARVRVRRSVSGKRFNEIVPEEAMRDERRTTDAAAAVGRAEGEGRGVARESMGELRYGNRDLVKHASKFQEAQEEENSIKREKSQKESSKKETRKASKGSKSKSAAADKDVRTSRDLQEQSGPGLVRKMSRNFRKKQDSATKASPVPPPILPLPASGSLHVGLENIGRDGYAVVQGPTNPPRKYMLDKILTRKSSELERLPSVQPHASTYKGVFVKSPVRSRVPKEAQFEHSKSSSNATVEPPSSIDLRSSLDMLTMAQPPVEDSGVARPSLEVPTIARPSLEVPRAVAGHSKSPSMVSTGSNIDDNQSDASSAVLSHAQSVSMQRGIPQAPQRPRPETPPMSNPPPNIALPPVPEGQTASQIPRPVDTIFEQDHDSPDRSPTRTKSSSERYTVFPKSPTRKPVGEARRPVSPIKSSKDEKSDRLVSKPSVKVRISQNFPDVPPPDNLSSDEKKASEPCPDAGPAMPAELPAEGMSRSRPERTRGKKIKGLERHRPWRADRDMPPMPDIKPGSSHHDQLLRFSMTKQPEQYAPLDVIRENAKEHQDVSEGTLQPASDEREGQGIYLGLSPVLHLDQRPAIIPSKQSNEKATPFEPVNGDLVSGMAQVAQPPGKGHSPRQRVNGEGSATRLLDSPQLEPGHLPDSAPAQITNELIKSISSKSIREEVEGFETPEAKIRRLESTIETLVRMLAQGVVAKEAKGAGDGKRKGIPSDAKPGAQALSTANHEDDSSTPWRGCTSEW